MHGRKAEGKRVERLKARKGLREHIERQAKPPKMPLRLEVKLAGIGQRFEYKLLRENYKDKLSPGKQKELRRLMGQALKALRQTHKSVERIHERHGLDIESYGRRFEGVMRSRDTPEAEKKALAKEYRAHLEKAFDFYEKEFLLYDFLCGEMEGKVSAHSYTYLTLAAQEADNHLYFIGDIMNTVKGMLEKLEEK